MSELLFREKHEKLPDGSLSFTVTVVGKIDKGNVKQIGDKLASLCEMGGKNFVLALYEAEWRQWRQSEKDIDEIAQRFKERGYNVELVKEKPEWLVQREVELAEQAYIRSLPFGKDLWEKCWNKKEKLFDFTTDEWANLEHGKQVEYAEKYQSWYAKRKGVSLEYRDEKTGMDFVLIPGGIFLMGSEDSDYDDEKPIHKVTVKPFLMSKYVMIQRVWQQIMDSIPWQGRDYIEEGDDYPAVFVSWDNAKEFCSKTGLLLPSEAQWEYACRCGTQTEYYWGDETDGDYFWYTDNTWGIGEQYVHKVGQKKPNAFGLYDMSGNVWEWCEDKWHDNYQGAPTGGSAWTKASSSDRLRRGGGFRNRAGDCRSARRAGYWAVIRDFSLGFRVVRPAPLDS